MSEYSYEIDKYIVGVDSNGEDGIGLTIATMKDNELHILGSCYGDNARFIDLLIKENQKLKKQLEYLRSGEYYNQLRFERDMLQNVVDKKEISKEDKEFIDMTQRNTELLEENQKLKKQLEVGEEQYNNLVEEKENLQEQLSIKTLQLEEYKNQVDKGLYNVCLPYSTGYNKAIEEMENQQKDFIDWLEENYKNTKDIWYIKILNKYKEIIGVSNENNT